MRIDARKGDQGWDVFDVPACRRVERCVWVDDVLAQYGAWPNAEAIVSAALFSFFGPQEPPVTQAKRIVLHADRRLVLIDPVEDSEPEADATTESIAHRAPVAA